MISEKVLRNQAKATQGAVCMSGPQMLKLLDEVDELRAVVDLFLSQCSDDEGDWPALDRARLVRKPSTVGQSPGE